MLHSSGVCSPFIIKVRISLLLGFIDNSLMKARRGDVLTGANFFPIVVGWGAGPGQKEAQLGL